MENKNDKTDQTSYAAEKIAEAKAAVAATNSLEDPATLDALLSAEKKCRLSNDALATRDVAVCIVALCRERKDWERLNSMMTTLAKRRSQSKVVIGAIVEVGLAVMDAGELGSSESAREALLKVLAEITEGKMYCEGERAKITRMLSNLYEARGDVSLAADTLQDVNVETYGSLSKREKVDYILDQVRLMLAKGDLVRAYILSKKVQRKMLLEDELQDLKIRFYKLMATYHVIDDAPFDLAEDFWAIFETKCVLEDEPLWKEALSSTALFLALSEHSSQSSDMMHRVLLLQDAKLKQLPAFHAALKLFTCDEIIAYPLACQAELEQHAALHTAGTEVAARWSKTLHTRVVQHNVRVLAKYYRQIKMPRLAQLLGLSEDDAERHVAHMVSDLALYCKIDRPAGIVTFAQPKPADEVLSDWASDISKMLNLVEMTCHLINKENMIHGI